MVLLLPAQTGRPWQLSLRRRSWSPIVQAPAKRSTPVAPPDFSYSGIDVSDGAGVIVGSSHDWCCRRRQQGLFTLLHERALKPPPLPLLSRRTSILHDRPTRQPWMASHPPFRRRMIASPPSIRPTDSVVSTGLRHCLPTPLQLTTSFTVSTSLSGCILGPLMFLFAVQG